MTSVFLSYAHINAPRVRVIERALRARGHDVFWDEDIPTGKNWRKTLQDRVLGAQCVLVAWTPESVKSKYVLLECEVAAEHSRLIPVLLEDASLPSSFEHLQAADLRNWIGNVRSPEWEKVVALVEEFGSHAIVPPKDKVELFKPDSPVTNQNISGGTDADSIRSWKGINLQDIVEKEIRTGLDLSPVQKDAFRDITTIRVRGDKAFLEELHGLESHGYKVIQRKPGEALLERRRRFSWVIAAMLALVFVLPAIVYIAIYPWLPKVHRIYVVQIE